ncbi:hypothetical protein [Longimicrobium terrae]|uniref:Cysteinyl-tRNA synthetase n=1 Tax=Longimicrobium terrae TaxID=1639882 RepID=A0A841H731_9BACT|nr:hypothetical protein [Longimicrobium terrae]MBB4639259.1 hypothetical protein [Longimicrobium terrae]MBB6073499.1 hypothetical protein [Longimicrobium terrae]
MPDITEGDLTFEFPAEWAVSKLDGWSFYRNQFTNVGGGTKSVDIVASEPQGRCLWLIEVKDFRQRTREKVLPLAEEFALKVRDSLAVLAAARFNANDDDEKSFADKALRAHGLRIVLHLEQTARPSKLFPRAVDAADVLQRLKQITKPIDPHPVICSRSDLGRVRWLVK